MLKKVAVFAIAGIISAFTLNLTNAAVFQGTGVVRQTIEPEITSSIRPGIDGFNGHLTWVAPVGTYAKGPIYDASGKVIKKGDILAKCDTRFYDYSIEQKEGLVESTKGNFIAKEYEYKRAKRLLPTEAISQAEHDIAEGEFFDAKGAHEEAIGELKYEKLLLENCEIRAKQDCYVTKILNFPGSWTNVDYPVAEVMLITPMLVDVKMSRQNAKKVVNGDLPVQLFVEGYDKPLSAFVQYIQLTKEGVSIPVDNYFYPIKDKDVPVVNNYAYVLRFDRERDSKTLGVPVYCIHIDSKGYYVWKAVGQKFMGPKPIPDKFKVEKTYIMPGNEARMAGPIGRILTVT